MKRDCACGRTKPYRRTFSCHKCWFSFTEQQRQDVLSIGRGEGKGTLRAGQKVREVGK